MEERGIDVDHSTINRWTLKYSPLLDEAFHRRQRPVWLSWRMDETSIKGKDPWRYLYHAVDKYGATLDFLLTAHRAQKVSKTTRSARRATRSAVSHRASDKRQPVWTSRPHSVRTSRGASSAAEINRISIGWSGR
jgi:transposase-like protein